MSSTPFMPLWVSDFIGDTLDLDAKEIGAYMLLLMAMWQRGGSLPDDDGKLQRVARVGREWPKVWAALKPFFTVENGLVENKRLTQELQKVAAKREVNAHAGSLGGRAKALKNNKQALANATVSLKQPYPEPEPERKKQERRARERALRSEFEDFWNGWPNKVGKPKALTSFIGKRKTHSLQAIIAGRDRYVRTKPPDRPWLNPATFLNQERFNDQPAETGKPAATGVELPKWEGPESDRQQDSEPEDSGVLRGGSVVHFREKGGGQRPLLCDQSGGYADRVDEVADLLSADARGSPGNVLSA